MQRFYLFRFSVNTRWKPVALGRFDSAFHAQESIGCDTYRLDDCAIVVTDLEDETLYMTYGFVPLDIEERIEKAIEEAREERRKIADSIAF